MEAADAARLADRVATAMEQKETDADRLRSLSDALAALAGRLEAADAARLADRVATAMEKETDADRLRSLSDALAALAGRLEAADAARLADRVATAMEKETDADRLRSLSYALAALAGRLEPGARQTRLFGLSHVLLDEIPGPPRDGERKAKANTRRGSLLRPLDKEQLVEVLKWPFCVGDAEKLVLAKLERKLTDEFKRPIFFGGDLGKFVDQAPSLGIKNHITPAHRPRLEDVRKELAALRQAAASKP